MTPNLVELAEGLSEAQRRAIVEAVGDGVRLRVPEATHWSTWRMLRRKELGTTFGWLTPLGQQVRNHLLSQGKEMSDG